MEQTLKDIRLLLLIAVCILTVQFAWFFGEKIMAPAAAIAAAAITDVNIAQIGGYPVDNHYAPAIKTK